MESRVGGITQHLEESGTQVLIDRALYGVVCKTDVLILLESFLCATGLKREVGIVQTAVFGRVPLHLIAHELWFAVPCQTIVVVEDILESALMLITKDTCKHISFKA